VKQEQAKRLVASLNAAFPNPKMPEATFALYAAELCRLWDEQAAFEAIAGLIRSSSWLPSIAEILQAYHPIARRSEEHRQALEREEALLRSQTRGLKAPRKPEPLPENVVAWMRERGMAPEQVLKDVDEESAA
jgi:hypothetical protein